jgi:hypothetical protein
LEGVVDGVLVVDIDVVTASVELPVDVVPETVVVVVVFPAECDILYTGIINSNMNEISIIKKMKIQMYLFLMKLK